jgi:type I restriction enzyme S subunit
MRLRFVATLGPLACGFGSSNVTDEVSFLPLERIWADARFDPSERIEFSGDCGSYNPVSEGDLLVPKVSPTFAHGRTALARGLVGGRALATSEVFIVRAHEPADARFLQYRLLAPDFLETGKSAWTGVAGLKRVSAEFVRNVRIDDTSWRARRDIVDILDRECERISRAVELGRVLRDRTVDRVSEIRRAVLGIPALEAELAGTTRGADRPRLKHAVDRWFSGATPTSTEPVFWTEPPDGVPWVAIGDMSQRAMVQDTARALSSLGLQETRQVVAPAGTVLVAMYASVGEVAELDRRAAFNQALLGLWIEDPRDRAFVIEWIHALRPLLGLFVRANTQANLSAEVVRDLPFVVMSREERVAAMAAINEARREMDRVVAHVAAIQSRLTAYRSSLIHEAVTGKLDVTAASDRQMDERLHAAAENRLDEVPA